MSAQHPSAPSAGREAATGVDRFVSLRLPARGPATSTTVPGEVVLARLDDELRPDAVVLARPGDVRADAPGGDPSGAGALEVRRVGRVTAESVELLPFDEALDGAAPPHVVPRTADAVVGTVVLRWTTG